jgi:hypothetical protein
MEPPARFPITWEDVSDRLDIRACHLSIFGWQTREHRSNHQKGAQAVNHTVYTVQSRKTKTRASTRTLSTDETLCFAGFAGFAGEFGAAMNSFTFADCMGRIRPKPLLRRRCASFDGALRGMSP